MNQNNIESPPAQEDPEDDNDNNHTSQFIYERTYLYQNQQNTIYEYGIDESQFILSILNNVIENLPIQDLTSLYETSIINESLDNNEINFDLENYYLGVPLHRQRSNAIDYYDNDNEDSVDAADVAATNYEDDEDYFIIFWYYLNLG